MAREASIAALLFDRLDEFVSDPAIPVAYPEVDNAIPSGSPHIAADFAPADTVSRSTGSGSDEMRGILALTVVWPRHKGLIAPLKVAVALIEHFPRDFRLVDEDGNVIGKIARTGSIRPYFAEGDTVRFPIRIPYVAFVKTGELV